MHSKTNLVSFKSTTTTYWLFPLLSQESLEKLVAELFNCTKMLEEKGIEGRLSTVLFLESFHSPIFHYSGFECHTSASGGWCSP